MNNTAWRYALASAVGTSHTTSGTPCQDASVCEVLYIDSGEPILVAVVSDGAGSASHSEIGSRLACATLLEEISALLGSGGRTIDVTSEFAAAWLRGYQQHIQECAEQDGLKPRDFACTVLAAIVGADTAAFIQVGDGAIVISTHDRPDQYECVFWPQTGEYVNETLFATDPISTESFEFQLIIRSIDEIAILSDGLQQIALHFASKSAYAPFFGPMLAPVRAGHDGHVAQLSSALELFLNSAEINSRTDDDKTLILATRRNAAPPPVSEDVHGDTSPGIV
ncbi:MAG: PP2C family serine/threonine-protein phosphatase [Chloroflexi bacterium]|nr:PP2C family serine/threonine-protein phosphatase [Chloroflexota bacterium]